MSEALIPRRNVKEPLLFECAWEVANKGSWGLRRPCLLFIDLPVVGGIYTVIKTKVPVTVSEYGDRYCLIGPLSYKTAPMEVESQEPTDPTLVAVLAAMRERGVKCLYGRWLIEGAPKVLLFDTSSMYHRLDEWKGDLWNLAGIPTPPNDQETNETIILGYLVAWFLGEVRYHCSQSNTCVLRIEIAFIVRGTAIDTFCGCTFPRVAGWPGHPTVSEATFGCHHCLYYTCNSAWPLSLRRVC